MNEEGSQLTRKAELELPFTIAPFIAHYAMKKKMVRSEGLGCIKAPMRKTKMEIPVGEGQLKTYLAICLTLCSILALKAQGQSMPMQTMSGILGLVQTIPLPTQGYMDRLTVDAKDHRLFICGEVIKSLVVVDLRAGKVVHVDRKSVV